MRPESLFIIIILSSSLIILSYPIIYSEHNVCRIVSTVFTLFTLDFALGLVIISCIYHRKYVMTYLLNFIKYAVLSCGFFVILEVINNSSDYPLLQFALIYTSIIMHLCIQDKAHKYFAKTEDH